MKAHYDGTPVELPEYFIDALVALMKAECKMMSEAIDDPKYWKAGRAYVKNLAYNSGIEFIYGCLEDFDDGLGDFAVVVLEDEDDEDSESSIQLVQKNDLCISAPDEEPTRQDGVATLKDWMNVSKDGEQREGCISMNEAALRVLVRDYLRRAGEKVEP